MEGQDNNQVQKSEVVRKFLAEYAKTKKDKVKYKPEDEEKAKKDIDKLNRKNKADFESKGKVIRDLEEDKIDLEEEKEKALIKLSKSKLKSQYRSERFNKTADDKDENGNSYEPIKMTIEEALKTLDTTDEELKEAKEKESEKQNENNDQSQENNTESKGKKKKKDKKKKQDEQPKTKVEPKYLTGNATSIANAVGLEYDKQIDDYKATVEKNLQDFKNTIEANARKRGYELGVKDVQKYNEQIKKQAKKLHNLKKKNASKAKVKTDSAIQKTKLKIAAMLGL